MTLPTLKNNSAFKERQYNPYREGIVPGAGAGYKTMSFEGVTQKTGLSFLVLLAAGAVGWLFPMLALPAVLVAFVLALYISFKNVSKPWATLVYSGLQGVAVGGISGMMERIYPGIVSQAVLATLAVFVVVLVLFRMKIFRTTPKLNKIFLVALLGYSLFGLINLGLMLFNVTPGMFGLYSDLGGWGIAIGILGTLLASYSLVMDFEYIENGVNNGTDEQQEWIATFSLVATLVWLYVEILRILALFRQ